MWRGREEELEGREEIEIDREDGDEGRGREEVDIDREDGEGWRGRKEGLEGRKEI